MNAHDIQLRRVRSIREPEFDDLIAIYTEAHPQSERKSADRLATMIQQPGYYFLVAVESSVVVGFSIVRAFDHSDAALLEYMAVARDLRNQGIGRQLFIKSANFEEVSTRFLLAEVDSEKKPTCDRADRIRRKNFYRMLGCREVDQLCYIMPPVSSSMPPDMDVLVYEKRLPPYIERTRLRVWLECCYVQVYGQSATDPRIDAMLHGLPENVPLI